MNAQGIINRIGTGIGSGIASGIFKLVTDTKRRFSRSDILDNSTGEDEQELSPAESRIVRCLDGTSKRKFLGARRSGKEALKRARQERIDALTSARVVYAERVRRLRAVGFQKITEIVKNRPRVDIPELFKLARNTPFVNSVSPPLRPPPLPNQEEIPTLVNQVK